MPVPQRLKPALGDAKHAHLPQLALFVIWDTLKQELLPKVIRDPQTLLYVHPTHALLVKFRMERELLKLTNAKTAPLDVLLASIRVPATVLQLRKGGS